MQARKQSRMPLNYPKIEAYASEYVVAEFYKNRIKKLRGMKLKADILSRKNPYLFKAKNIGTSESFVRYALDAYLSSQEETMFGNLLENFAIYICAQAYGGKKAATNEMKSVDLEFVKDGIYYIVGIKSGIYWGNSDQIGRMKSNFKIAKQKLRAKGITLPIVAVNGCMYGKDRNPHKVDLADPGMTYYKYCGQDFWEFISGDPAIYITIIHPLDVEAKKREPEFMDVYNTKLEGMAAEFRREFVVNNKIDWVKLIEFVSKNDGRSTPLPTDPSLPGQDSLFEE